MNNGLGLFFMVPFVPVKGKFNATAYNDILDKYVLPIEEGSFLFNHDNAPMHKVRSIQKWFVEISVEELDWTAQSLDPLSYTFGMNWNAACKPGLIAHPH